MNTPRLMCVGIVVLGAIYIPTAHALQTTTWVDLTKASINIVDINTGDSITPFFSLADYQSSAVASQFSSSVYSPQYSNDWDTNLSATYSSAPPGATAFAALTNNGRTATASITGFSDYDKVYASTDYRASFVLGAGTQATFAFDGRVTMTGADPYDSYHEAYAIIQAYFQNADGYGLLAVDDLRAEAWMDENTDVLKPFSLTITNNGTTDIIGWLDIGALTQTVSKVPPTQVPEPATLVLCLAGLGLMGLCRRRMHA